MNDSVNFSRRNFLLGWVNRIRHNIKEISELSDLLKHVDGLIASKEYKKAEKFLIKIDKNFYDSVEVKKRLGIVYYNLKKYEKATEVFKHAISKGEDNLSYLYLAIIEGENNNEKEALSYLKQFFDPQNIILQREINLNLALYEAGEISFKEVIRKIKETITR